MGMLEKTSLAEQGFNSIHTDIVSALLKEIKELRAKVEELRDQIKWLEQENAKNL